MPLQLDQSEGREGPGIDIAARIEKIERVILAKQFHHANEADLQLGIEVALGGAQIPYEREFHLGPGERPDFLVDSSIALEVKVGGPSSSVIRQLERYAKHDIVEALVLVTRRSQHRSMLEYGAAESWPTILGKPFKILVLRTGL